MPRIPDSSQLGYSVPKAQTPRFQDRSRLIVGDAVTRGVERVTDVVSRAEQREASLNLAAAQSLVQTEDIKTRRELEGDSDFSTYETRYTERMMKARDKAAGLIRAPAERTLFESDAGLAIERGIGAMRGAANVKKADNGRATLDQIMINSRELLQNAADEPSRTAIINTVSEGISGAVASGYITAEQGVAMRH